MLFQVTKPKPSYFEPIDKTSQNLIIPSISFINSRLDISTLLSTKKKPCRETAGLFYLKQTQACLRTGANKKALTTR